MQSKRLEYKKVCMLICGFFITIILSAAFASITAFKCKPNQVPMNYHAIHSIGLALYGLSFLLLAEELETFLISCALPARCNTTSPCILIGFVLLYLINKNVCEKFEIKFLPTKPLEPVIKILFNL
jgi:hypothetical protein